MPQLICRGLKEKEVAQLSVTLSEELAKLTDTAKDWFLFEHIERNCYVSGEKVTGDPIIDIMWFDRGQQVKDSVGKAVDSAVRALGYAQIEVVFHPLEKESYFENGEHY